VRAGVRVVKRYRETRLEQDILLYDRVPRIDFVTRVDWRERQLLLKAAFPLDIRALSATFEVQFGAVERPTHRNTSWEQEKFEVCGHRWADLSEAGYGVSLLNDSKYGWDAKGNVLRLTLLRGTEYPDPAADLGQHVFTYSLMPHAGDWREGETVRRAWELNVPIVCLPAFAGDGDLPGVYSFLEVLGPAVLETIKPAENGDGWILRLYEPHGGRGRVAVHTALHLAGVCACNHVEEDGEPLAVSDGSFVFEVQPYQVRTFRVRLA
jgi:alpha-mannosidase